MKRVIPVRMTPDQVKDYLMDLSISHNFTDTKYSKALNDCMDMIDEYRVLLSDIMHYGLVRCKNCSHYSMTDEDTCHVCYNPLK